MLNRIAQRARDSFLASYFVEGLRAPLTRDYLIGHVRDLSSFEPRIAAILFWPDPGLSRNTRCRCYRCSVPGLAGFTRLALCGARDLIKHFRFSIAECQFESHSTVPTLVRLLHHQPASS